VFLGRVVAAGEPHWLDSDRDKVIAYELEQRTLCPCGCGRPATESMARANQLRYGAEVVRCHARAAMDRQTEWYRKQKGSDEAGLLVRLTRTPAGPIVRG
jgi:hypothetical protein